MSLSLDIDDEPTPGLGPDGRPDPAYAHALGLVPAPLGRRSGAFAIDAAIWMLLAAPAVIGYALLAAPLIGAGGEPGRLEHGSVIGPLIAVAVGQGLTLVFGLVQLILHGRLGVTVGKAAAGLRSVSARDFGRPGFWRVVLRATVLWGSQFVLPFIGPAIVFSSSFWDPERRNRSWLDRVGECYLVDSRHGLDPFDARSLRRARRAVAAPTEAEVAQPPSLASDRPADGAFLIPVERSSSGVVSPGARASEAWTPPPIGGAAPRDPVMNRIVLRFDDDTEVEASDFGLIGRAPAAADASAQLVPVDDPTKQISKVHVEFGVTAGGFWITDRGSTNGTDVRRPGGRIEGLRPGARTPLEAGSVVLVGGRSFTVTSEPRKANA